MPSSGRIASPALGAAAGDSAAVTDSGSQPIASKSRATATASANGRAPASVQRIQSPTGNRRRRARANASNAAITAGSTRLTASRAIAQSGISLLTGDQVAAR